MSNDENINIKLAIIGSAGVGKSSIITIIRYNIPIQIIP